MNTAMRCLSCGLLFLVFGNPETAHSRFSRHKCSLAPVVPPAVEAATGAVASSHATAPTSPEARP